MKQRIRKLTGLQEAFIELDSGDTFQPHPEPTPQPQPQSPSPQTETHNTHGQLVES